jgi:predicted PurR-regulated permease PerM
MSTAAWQLASHRDFSPAWPSGFSACLSPVLWGLVTAMFSLIPIIGSAAVWGPAAIILLVSGHWVKALILLAWGAAIVGQIDTVVRPYVISGKAKLHTLLVFFALLGGVQAFGVMGLFIGPVLLSITLVLLQMLQEENQRIPAS